MVTSISAPRSVTVAELPCLLETAREFYAESPLVSVLSFDERKFVRVWTELISNGTGAIFVIERNGEVAGAISGVVYPEIYSDALICQEFFLFVRKPFRTGFGLLKLLRAIESYAKQKGCSELRLAHLEDSYPEELARLYVRRGFHKVESSYGKRL